jgi:hypothetical protein
MSHQPAPNGLAAPADKLPFTPLTAPDFGAGTATAPTGRYVMPSPEAQALFSEARLGQECGLWLQDFHREAYDVFAHIPNGGLRTAVEGNSFKLQHARAGYPDYFLAKPYVDPYQRHIQYCGLYIELKTKKGRVAPLQAEWHQRLRTEGYRVEVVRSLPEFIDLLTEYLA